MSQAPSPVYCASGGRFPKDGAEPCPEKSQLAVISCGSRHLLLRTPHTINKYCIIFKLLLVKSLPLRTIHCAYGASIHAFIC